VAWETGVLDLMVVGAVPGRPRAFGDVAESVVFIAERATVRPGVA